MRVTRKGTTVAIVLAVAVGGGLAFRQTDRIRQRSLLTSCYNHKSFVPAALLDTFPGNDSEGRHFKVLPHDPDLPGYGLMAKYVLQKRVVLVGGRRDGESIYRIKDMTVGQNCHHGAPGRANGGWQALNLPPEKMNRLWEAHQARRPHNEDYVDLPFFWCGKGNPLGSGRAGGLLYKSEEEWEIERASVSWAALSHLQDCLHAIGEPPVAIDIPDDIDWERFEADDSHKVIPDHIDASGQVVFRTTPRR